MKQLLSLILIILLFQEINGQTDSVYKKGKFLVGGFVTLYLENENDLKSGLSPNPDVTYRTIKRSFETDFNLGYFPVNHLSIGLKNELLFSSYETKSSLTGLTIWNVKDRNFIIGPFIRYYTFKGIFFECYGGLGVYYNSINGTPSKLKICKGSIGVGYSLIISPNVSFESIVSYNFINQKDEANFDKISSSKLLISFGLQVYLNLKK